MYINRGLNLVRESVNGRGNLVISIKGSKCILKDIQILSAWTFDCSFKSEKDMSPEQPARSAADKRSRSDNIQNTATALAVKSEIKPGSSELASLLPFRR